MQLNWEIEPSDVKRVKALISEQKGNALVRVRFNKNCSDKKKRITRDLFWKQMVCMRLTSQQNSSPDGPVGRFARAKPFPLSYADLVKARSVEATIKATLTKWRGIRFASKIAKELSTNLKKLEAGEWDRVMSECSKLSGGASVAVEREVAEYVRARFLGFGSKQSRNLLQALHLTRYEIPIDSRITAWLNKSGFPVHLAAAALADPNYYDFVSTGILELCRRSNVVPCVFDAAIFSLKEGDKWTIDNAF